MIVTVRLRDHASRVSHVRPEDFEESGLARSEGARHIAATDGIEAAPHAADPAPRHVAIIMDGNGRWAAQRGLPRFEGHRRGVEAVRRAVHSAMALGIEFLTIYSFSSENWRRPPAEIAELMGLLKLFVRHDLEELHACDVRIRVIGERDNLAPEIVGLLREAEARTKDNGGLTLVVAFNYGGRQEIVAAMRRLAKAVADGRLSPDAIDPETVAAALDTAGLPDPDLVIRTSGELRLSNFLTWQSAYAEYVTTPALWPDFDHGAFLAAIDEYHRRDRRYGGLSSRAEE